MTSLSLTVLSEGSWLFVTSVEAPIHMAKKISNKMAEIIKDYPTQIRNSSVCFHDNKTELAQLTLQPPIYQLTINISKESYQCS